MLTYHPLHDPSHCIFRFYCIYNDVERKIHIDLLRLLDFYILFPYALKTLSMPKDMVKFKNIFRKIPLPYENLPTPSRLMFELSLIQDQAIKSLMAKGIFEKKDVLSGYITMQNQSIPDIIQKLIHESTFRNTEWYNTLVKVISKMELWGENGLKRRSGLLEYRYDNV